MSGTCQNCGRTSGDIARESPPNPLHCGHCPPWTCADCGEQCSATDLCRCWVSVEGMSLADLKAIFAQADLGLEISSE